MKRVAILQSNYIPWKGYFDLIAYVDEFVLYDDVQFTKNDWRNRNRVKSPKGVEWITVPVGKSINRRICDVVLPNTHWQLKHWKTLESNYGRASCFSQISDVIAPLYLGVQHTQLSALNKAFINAICGLLRITTRISSVSDYTCGEGKTDRLIDICMQAGASTYVSGPSAREYLNAGKFKQSGIELEWFGYEGYPAYRQLWGSFIHEVTVLDLLFNCGSNATNYMMYARR